MSNVIYLTKRDWNYLKPLQRGFYVRPKTGGILIRCRICGARWSLVYGSYAPGNILHLLNHEAGHDVSDAPE